MGELVDRVVRKNTNNESTLPLTISAQYGLVDQITYFNNRVASRDVSNYYLVLNGEFAYNKSTSDGYPFGAVKRLDLYEKGVLSTLYIVFAPKKEQQIDSDYLTVFFDTDRWHKGVAERAAEGARNHGLLNISAEDFFDIDLSVPKDIVEQKQIGAFIRQLDNLITLHQRKCVFLFGFFQAFISMIFTASTFSWEQRKVSELFRVTRGYVLAATQTETTKTDEKPYPVYSSQTKDKGLMGYYKDYLYEDAITWTTDGANAGTVNYRAGKFYCTNVCGVLLSNEVKANQMIAEALNSVAKGYVSYVGNPKLMNNVMADIVIQIPTQAEEREQLSSFFAKLDNLITLHQRECISFTARAGRLILTANKKRSTSSWEQRKFSDITFPAGEKNKDNLPLESYSITNEHGFVPQDEKFENGGTMREADKRMYYIVSPNSFAYNPARINVGSIGYQNIGKNVIVSSLYEVFKTSEDVDDRLLWHWFKSPDFQKLIMQLQEGGVRLYFYYDKLCMGEVSLPSLEEQRKIGKLFDTLDNLITLHQRKPFLMKWRTSDANRNQTNRLVL